jgi:hypothetical protein
MNFFRESPEATLRQLIASSRKPSPGHLPLINIREPAKSLLVLKPTSKVPAKDADGQFEKPAYAEPVSHMGGLKMFVDDHSYKAFLGWIRDYARVVGDEYAEPAELPLDNWRPTQQVLRLADVPADWSPTAPVQLFVHAWDAARSDWQSQPVAFTQGTVTPRRMVNGTLFVLADKADLAKPDAEFAELPPGKYLIKAYVDSQGKLAGDPTLLLGSDDYIGQAALDARWQLGFQQAEVLPAAQLKRE